MPPEGYRFLPIDLRRGVSESASSSQRTLPIIFEELARCRRESPDFCFLLLLGDRYGSRLLPDTIPIDEYERLAAHLDDAGRIVAAMTAAGKLLGHGYHCSADLFIVHRHEVPRFANERLDSAHLRNVVMPMMNAESGYITEVSGDSTLTFFHHCD